MAKIINRLTDVRTRKAAPGLHPDGDGLYLQVRGKTALGAKLLSRSESGRL